MFMPWEAEDTERVGMNWAPYDANATSLSETRLQNMPNAVNSFIAIIT